MGLKNKKDLKLLAKGVLHTQNISTLTGYIRTINIRCEIPHEWDIPDGSMIELYLRKDK